MSECKVTFKTKLSYGLGAFGKDFIWALTATFLMFYFTDIAGIAPAFIGTVFLVARIMDAFTDPVMGMIVDNTRSRYGKFRPWILIGTLVNSLFVVALFLTHTVPSKWTYAYAAFTYIMWGLTYTIMDIPFWSMISSLSKSREERERIVVWPRLFATVAGALIGTYGLTTVDFFGEGNMGTGFIYLSVFCVIAFIISSIITIVNVKPVTESSSSAEKLSFKDIINTIKLNDQLRVLVAFVLLYGIGASFVGGLNIYYVVQVLGRQDLFAMMALIGSVGGPLAVLSFPYLCNHIPRRYLWLLVVGAQAMHSLILITAIITGQENAIFLGAAAVFMSVSGGLNGVLMLVLLGDIIDYGEHKTGQRTESIIFSSVTMLTKANGAVSAFLIGITLTVASYVPNQVISDYTAASIRAFMVVPSLVLMLTSAYIYTRYYKLHADDKQDSEAFSGVESLA